MSSAERHPSVSHQAAGSARASPLGETPGILSFGRDKTPAPRSIELLRRPTSRRPSQSLATVPLSRTMGATVARRTFFSFHYERDVWRANVVRNSAKLKPAIDAEFIDASLWEEAKRKSRAALERLIQDGLRNTTVTAVLIGPDTASRQWVNYEIDRSIERGNGLLGIYIHNIEDREGRRAPRGANPLPPPYATYDWINDRGYDNLGSWVETAYEEAH